MIVTCEYCGKAFDKNNSDSSGVCCDNCGYLLPTDNES
jgi:DNA-directed RNA polymerase subunit RPC12/RpoP